MAKAEASESLTPTARPRTWGDDVSAMTAVAATNTALHPTPTRKMPRVIGAYRSKEGTSSAPRALMINPHQSRRTRPTRSASRPRGMENAYMPMTCSVTAMETAVSEWPWCLSTRGVAAMSMVITPWAGA